MYFICVLAGERRVSRKRILDVPTDYPMRQREATPAEETMSGLTFTEIDQSIKDRRRLHLTLLKNGRTCARFVLRVVEYFRGKRDE